MRDPLWHTRLTLGSSGGQKSLTENNLLKLASQLPQVLREARTWNNDVA